MSTTSKTKPVSTRRRRRRSAKELQPLVDAAVANYREALVRLRALARAWEASNRPVRDVALLLYLMRRAKRPLHALLWEEYEHRWGRSDSGSYFFGSSVYSAIWHEVTAILDGRARSPTIAG